MDWELMNYVELRKYKTELLRDLITESDETEREVIQNLIDTITIELEDYEFFQNQALERKERLENGNSHLW